MDQSSTLLAFPQQPEDRLRLALRRLEAALAEQAEAVAEFRSNLGALKEATSGLATQVNRYNDTLGQAAVQANHAHQAALRLERTADRMVAIA
jgi:ABC-type transporter Mla subunit MlaD